MREMAQGTSALNRLLFALMALAGMNSYNFFMKSSFDMSIKS